MTNTLETLAEPTPADRFVSHPDPGSPEARRKLIDETIARWKAEGVKQMRATLTGPDIEGDKTGYPPGLWLEGWNDENARQLPFGDPWPADGPVWPPLTYAEPAA